MTRPFSRLLAGALALAGAACSEAGTGPSDGASLSVREARSLAYGVSVLGTDNAEDLAWSDASFSVSSTTGPSLSASAHPGGGGPGGAGGIAGLGIWGPRRPGIHGTTTTTVDRTRPCPQGGTTRSVTTVASVVDTVARTGRVTTSSADTPAACAFTVDSLNTTLRTIANPGTVITITGAPSLVSQSTSIYSWAASDTARGGRLTRGATTGTQTGSFTYTTSDGRSGTCTVSLATAFDPAARTQKVSGTFCGRAVDVTTTLPEHGKRGGPGGGGHGR
jgi:hypothetical protein